MQIMRLAMSMLTCLFLAACGGGGSGHGSGDTSKDTGSGFHVSLDRTSITFDYAQGSLPQSQVVVATWTGIPPSPGYVGATVEGTAIDPAIILSISSTQATAQINTRSGLLAGDYTGRILFLVCSDPGCANKVGGSPLPITYTVRVHPPVITNTTPITFTHVLGSNAQTALINTTTQSGAWTANTSAPWLMLSAASGSGASTITVSYNTAGLADGTYRGDILVTGTGNITQSVQVALTIRTPTFSAAMNTLNFSGVLGSPIASQNLNVSLDSPSMFSWTVSSDASWLTLNKTSGTASDSITVGFDLQKSPISGSYQGHLQFTGLIEGRQILRTVNVALNLQRPSFVFTGATTFTGVNGTVIPAHNFNVALSNGLAVPFTLQSGANWIVLGQTSTATGNFTVSIDPAIGNLASEFPVPNSNVLVSTVVAGELLSADMTVYASLTPASIQISTTTVNFNFVNGQPVAPQHVSLNVNPSVPIHLVFTGGPPWLKFTDTSTNGSVGFDVVVDPTVGPMASGYYSVGYSAEAHVNGDVTRFPTSVIAAIGRPTLTIAPTTAVLGGPTGRVSEPVPLSLSLNTVVTNQYPWTLSQLPSFVTANKSFGTVSGTSQQIILTPHPDQAPDGALANLTFSADVNGDHLTTTLPLTLKADSHRVYASRNGIALVSTPAWNRLTDTVKIESNYSLPGTWSASSDQAWLSVTSSGSMNADLVISANATGLQTDRLYEATITVTPSSPALGDPEHIRVGLWAGSSTPTVDLPILKTGDFVYAVADPIRPYVYAHGVTGNIRVFNLYTGIEANAIVTSSGTPGGMVISSDGSTLYIADTNDNSVIPVDLTNAANRIGKRISAPTAGNGKSLRYLRPHGAGVVIATGWAFRADTLLTTHYSDTALQAAPSGDYTKLFIGGIRYDLDYTTGNGGEFVINKSGQVFATNFANDMASNFDGSLVCTIDFIATPFHCYNGVTLSDGPILQLAGDNQNVEMSVDGKTIIAVSSNYEIPDIEVLDTNLNVTHSFEVGDPGPVSGGDGGEIIPSRVVVSGDGFFVVAPVKFSNRLNLLGARLTILPVGP